MKICIVGGGSAGWMSATTFRDFDVTLVESPTIPISGVGESVLGQFRDWMTVVGIHDDTEFIKRTDATYKHSIKFTNFLRKDSGGFHYPFGHNQPIDPDNWWGYKNTVGRSCNDFATDVNPVARLAESGRVDTDEIYAYQFDAIKVGQYLKEAYCSNVEHIVADVVGYNGDSISLHDGRKVEADLFIDCTGFKSLLLGQYLKEPFIPYDHLIPNDTAVVCRLPYLNKEEQMVPYTECTAINNGWVWQIPLSNRIGSGYVYSSEFVSHDDAKQEFIDHLNSKGFNTSECEFRKVPMKIGRYERSWVGNVVAIGLSAGFLEPLEGNGLLSIHQNLIALQKIVRRGTSSSILRKHYNNEQNRYFDHFAEFIAVHYAFTQRKDTPYWKNVGSKEYDIDLGMDDKNFKFKHAGFTYIAMGMEVTPYVDHRMKERGVTKVENTHAKWDNVMKRKPLLHEVMKELDKPPEPVL